MANEYVPSYLQSARRSMQTGYSSAAAVEQAATSAAGRVQDKSRKANIAGQALTGVGTTAAVATSIAAAAGAANAVPIAGQVASAGLAIAALMTKIFTGRKQKKRADARAAKQRRDQANQSNFNPQQDAAGGIGIGNAQGPVGATAPVSPPQVPTFSGWNSQPNPAVQPPQDTL